ncbi:RHS repeat domain-containing protein, partial [Asticcacaulis biprosthecium]|uniref:RHS repeat domain-containing protein n=1 Tax=Asticcacaulis biprosthecium TaxID=76891 RepID=UPI00058C0F31
MSYYTTGSGGSTVVKGVKTVSSSNGWKLVYNRDASYVLTEVTAYNTSVDYCSDPAIVGCTLPAGYPIGKRVNESGETRIKRAATGLATGDEAFEARILSGGVIKTASGVTKTVVKYTAAESASPNEKRLDKVKSVQVGGSTWSYDYTFGTDNAVTATVTAPDSTTRTVVVNARGLITSQTDELGRQTKYEYDGAGRVLKVVAHDATYDSGGALTGGYTQYRYDTQGNLDKTSTYPRGGGAAIETSATYPGSGCTGKACRYPLATTDASNAVTTYTYDSVHGGVLSVISPAPTAGAARIGTFYTYATKTPRIKTSPTTDVAGTPVYRLVTTKTCAVQSLTSTNCDVSGDILWTKTDIFYDVDIPADPNDVGYTGATRNVLPYRTVVTRGDSAVTLTSESLYNSLGQVIYSYGPKASDDSSSDLTPRESFAFFDAIGRPVGGIGADPDGSARTMKRPATRTTYNSDGKVSAEESGVVPTSAYSGSTAIDRWNSAKAEWSLATTAGITVLEKNTNEFSTTTGLPIRARHYAALPVTA